MSNHLLKIHGIKKGNAREVGSLVKFLDNKKEVSMEKLTRESLLCAVGRYIVRCHISYQTVDHPEFRSMLELCNPVTKSLFPSADTLSNFILTTFINGQKALKSLLQKIPSKISLTCDGWTSPSNESLLGITAHWIENYELKSIILATKLIDGPHSGINLASHLAEVLKKYDIKNKIFCITADNASNNGTMAAELKKLIGFDAENCMLGCMPHVINLAAKVGINAFSNSVPQGTAPQTLAGILSDPPPRVDLSSLISRISKLCTYLKQSSQKAASFKDLSKAMNNGQALVMVADVATRWNSTFKMLERAYEIRSTIRLFCEQNSITEKYNLSDSEWSKVRQLCDFLEPLFQATKTMSKSKFPSMMLAAPVYTWIIGELQKVNDLFNFLLSNYSTDILFYTIDTRLDCSMMLKNWFQHRPS
jgi:hypothetical protein